MARRKTDSEPIIRPEYPDVDPILRDEVDPDPLVEEMVGRLRTGLSSMVAIDEWGRPVAWRNVVRLALGPLASKLRDTEQALNLAVSLIPDSEPLSSVEQPETAPPAPDLVPEQAAEPIAEALIDESDPLGLELPAEPVAEAEPAAEIAPQAVEAIAEAPAPGPTEPTALSGSGVGATALFAVSGDQRAVPMRSFSSRELLRGGGTNDATRAENNSFLASLYSQGQQVGRDKD